jgi:hypothetical protein
MLAVLSFSVVGPVREKTHTRSHFIYIKYKNKQRARARQLSWTRTGRASRAAISQNRPGGRRLSQLPAHSQIKFLNAPVWVRDFSGKEGGRASFCSTARRRRQRSAAAAIGLKWSCIFYTRTAGVAINQAGVLSRAQSLLLRSDKPSLIPPRAASALHFMKNPLPYIRATPFRPHSRGASQSCYACLCVCCVSNKKIIKTKKI